MKPEVSVIIPVHNGARYITKALDSVLIQDVPLEIIIIDDHSSDNLDEALSPYLDRENTHSVYRRGSGADAEDDSHVNARSVADSCTGIKLLRNRQNIGAARSRNRGVRASSGRYIAFLDCDDWWEKGKLKKQLALMKKTGCVLCSTGRRLVSPDGRKTRKVIRVKPVITYRSLLRQNPINCSSVVLLRDVAVMYPMSHDEYHEDYITWLRILRRYRRACAIDEPLLNYRLSRSGKSGSKLKSAYMTFKVYRYMGFSIPRSLACFAAYIISGILKYYII